RVKIAFDIDVPTAGIAGGRRRHGERAALKPAANDGKIKARRPNHFSKEPGGLNRFAGVEVGAKRFKVHRSDPRLVNPREHLLGSAPERGAPNGERVAAWLKAREELDCLEELLPALRWALGIEAGLAKEPLVV